MPLRSNCAGSAGPASTSPEQSGHPVSVSSSAGAKTIKAHTFKPTAGEGPPLSVVIQQTTIDHDTEEVIDDDILLWKQGMMSTGRPTAGAPRHNPHLSGDSVPTMALKSSGEECLDTCVEVKADALAYPVPVEATVTSGSSETATGSATAEAIAFLHPLQAPFNASTHLLSIPWCGTCPRGTLHDARGTLHDARDTGQGTSPR